MGKVKNNWIRPWNIVKFDNISNKDERFLSLLIKGALSYLTRNIMLYNKNINHYILSTGSEYLYVESNGYEFSWNTTSGEGTLYSKLPRCTVELQDILFIRDELSAPYSRGYYERMEAELLFAYSAEIKRLPIQVNLQCHYVLSNFNESIILIEELMNDLIWLRYFNINYLGLQVLCSIEFPDQANILYNKVDFGTEQKQKTIDISLIVKSSYPIINQRTEIKADKIINTFIYETSNTTNELDDETKIIE